MELNIILKHINTLSFNYSATSPASGTHIIGCEISYLNFQSDINNVIIERCYIGGNISLVADTGVVIKNNITYGYIYASTAYNLVVANNFIMYGNIVGPQVSTILVNNNIFINSSSASNSKYTTFDNNIFWYCNDNMAQSESFCIFDNDVTITGNGYTLPTGNNTGSGDVLNPSPLFVSTNIPINGLTYQTLANYNWQITSSSPAHNGGTDGTDIGIYGGTYPLPNLTGTSNIPQITNLTITNSSVPQNGNLNVELKARSQQ